MKTEIKNPLRERKNLRVEICILGVDLPIVSKFRVSTLHDCWKFGSVGRIKSTSSHIPYEEWIEGVPWYCISNEGGQP